MQSFTFITLTAKTLYTYTVYKVFAYSVWENCSVKPRRTITRSLHKRVYIFHACQNNNKNREREKKKKKKQKKKKKKEKKKTGRTVEKKKSSEKFLTLVRETALYPWTY